MFFTDEQIHSVVKFGERGAHFSKDGWEALVAGSAKHRRTEVGGGDKQTILVAYSYNSGEYGVAYRAATIPVSAVGIMDTSATNVRR